MSQTVVLYLGSLMLRSLCVAALAGVLTFRVRSIALRHAVWVVVLALTLLTPAAGVFVPTIRIPIPVQYAEAQPLPAVRNLITKPLRRTETSPQHVLVNASRGYIDVWQFAAITYTIIGAALLLRLGHACRQLIKLKRSSRIVLIPVLVDLAAAQGFAGQLPSIYESGSARVPLTVGFSNPWILLPTDWKDWDEWKLKAVLSHELTHIRRADWLISMLAAFGTCVFWFNPLSWWLERHLSNLSEKASDEGSVMFTGDAPRYAQVLLEFAAVAQTGRRLKVGVVPMAVRRIRSRIERILSMSHADRGFLKPATWILVFTLAAPVLYAASAVHIFQQALPTIAVAPHLPPAQPAFKPITPERTVTVKTAPTSTVEPLMAQAAPAPAPVPQENNGSPIIKNETFFFGLFQSGVQAQRLADLERQNADLSITFSPDYPLRKRLEAQIRDLRQAIASENALANQVASQVPPNTMILNRVEDRTLYFTGSNGNLSYSCADCTFFVGDTRVGGEEDGRPGVLVHLRAGGKEVEITCRAIKCSTTAEKGRVGLPQGDFVPIVDVRTFSSGETVAELTSGTLVISFVK